MTRPSSEQSGVGEGMVMFMLALQTGLTEIQMPQRVGAMSVILYIVLAILFQVSFVFQ